LKLDKVSSSYFTGQASYSSDLQVHSKPTIGSAQRNWTVFEGDSLSLPCDVSGIPEPAVTWRKGSTVFSQGDERVLSDNSLIIQSAKVRCSHVG